MPAKKSAQYSYLLRFWRVAEGAEAEWRASLQTPDDGERIGFASLDALFEYISQQTGATPNSRGRQHGGVGGHPGNRATSTS